MKSEDVIRRLQACLPLFTDYFTDQVAVQSITSSGLVATVITSIAHGLNTGDYVHISGALVPNPISSLSQVDGIGTGVTANNHDLTENYQLNVEIDGANESQYNGTHTLLTVPNRKTFTFEIDSGAPSPATGSPLLLEDLKRFTYNGWHEITKVNDTTFTFALEKSLGSPAYGDIKLKVKPRISGAGDLDEAVRAYTEQQDGRLWAFVVLDNMTASKDRSEATDATFIKNNATVYRQMVIQPFHVYVFYPNSERITTRAVRDLSDDLVAAFCKCLLRVKFPPSFTEDPYSGVVFVGHEFALNENSVVYVHDFVFETMAWITYDDTIDDDISVAFRDITDKYKSIFIDDGEIKFEGNINLDDEPLT